MPFPAFIDNSQLQNLMADKDKPQAFSSQGFGASTAGANRFVAQKADAGQHAVKPGQNIFSSGAGGAHDLHT